MMDLVDIDLLWPIVGAVVAGAVIGMEREYRASPAGFRTHILVCLASAVLMLAAVHQIRWLSDTPRELIRIDPVRMAHGILTGIGFLCGGVIFREGFNVRGLTTAASLWMTSALGILFGVGFYGLAIGGTIAAVVVLAALTLAEALLPRRRYAEIKVRYRRDSGQTPAGFRALLASHSLKPIGISQSAEAGIVAFAATVEGYREDAADALVQALLADGEVEGFDCAPHRD
ncbi:MgtC/SapB family protein [uncultured Phenylobacterium sp.]|uniref:MgtC/SapB family protein n=1 Tax=uncultured Phenylobacterium sp. TaxID=349273 RepID=UPI0025EF0932|nr:MgtC/SapB family protein [uncultured Phenylobacterium sp.]